MDHWSSYAVICPAGGGLCRSPEGKLARSFKHIHYMKVGELKRGLGGQLPRLRERRAGTSLGLRWIRWTAYKAKDMLHGRVMSERRLKPQIAAVGGAQGAQGAAERARPGELEASRCRQAS